MTPADETPVSPLFLARLGKPGKPSERRGQLPAVGKDHQQMLIGDFLGRPLMRPI
jgi:hypothetical protein